MVELYSMRWGIIFVRRRLSRRELSPAPPRDMHGFAVALLGCEITVVNDHGRRFSLVYGIPPPPPAASTTNIMSASLSLRRPNDLETLWPSKNNRGRQNDIIAEANSANEWPGQAELKRDTAEARTCEKGSISRCCIWRCRCCVFAIMPP